MKREIKLNIHCKYDLCPFSWTNHVDRYDDPNKNQKIFLTYHLLCGTWKPVRDCGLSEGLLWK